MCDLCSYPRLDFRVASGVIEGVPPARIASFCASKCKVEARQEHASILQQPESGYLVSLPVQALRPLERFGDTA